jgi:RNA polymerase sigma-70 factor (ECF subfamily)
MAEADLKVLLEAVARSDKAAFRLLYEATSPKLYGAAIRILKRSDLAEEVVQDAYLRIWDGADGYQPAFGAPLAWMATKLRLSTSAMSGSV